MGVSGVAPVCSFLLFCVVFFKLGQVRQQFNIILFCISASAWFAYYFPHNRNLFVFVDIFI